RGRATGSRGSTTSWRKRQPSGRPRSSRSSGVAACPSARRAAQPPGQRRPSPQRHERGSRERHPAAARGTLETPCDCGARSNERSRYAAHTCINLSTVKLNLSSVKFSHGALSALWINGLSSSLKNCRQRLEGARLDHG